jgi:nucleoside-diphosphate-sugar epimerase
MSDRLEILVTGGAGYIGSILLPELLRAGNKVTVLDNFLFRQCSLNHLCADPNFAVVRGDVRDLDLMKTLLRRADVVIPLAALVGAPLCAQDPTAARTVNRDALLAMLPLLSSEQRLLVPVTNSGYGIGESSCFCTEDTPMRPLSLYGTLKVEVERAVLARGNAISFRLATVFGMSPRMRIDLLVNHFVYRAVHERCIVLFDGHFRRNYIHVRDVARAFLHGLDNFVTMQDRPYNVGLSEANLSKRELCERIRPHVPCLVVMEAAVGEDPDKRDYIVSNERIERTGFKPVHGLDLGIAELVKGFTMLRDSTYGNQ